MMEHECSDSEAILDDNPEENRMVFNMLVRNTDDHPRNHGILLDEGKMSLSPAYDIVPTPARFGVDYRICL